MSSFYVGFDRQTIINAVAETGKQQCRRPVMALKLIAINCSTMFIPSDSDQVRNATVEKKKKQRRDEEEEEEVGEQHYYRWRFL